MTANEGKKLQFLAMAAPLDWLLSKLGDNEALLLTRMGPTGRLHNGGVMSLAFGFNGGDGKMQKGGAAMVSRAMAARVRKREGSGGF